MRKSLLVLAVFLLAATADAQYFGRNKVQWENFDFKVLQTEHFDIYYYDREADVVRDIGRMSERWYARLSRVFGHTFTRKPIVLYANAADFHQTTTTGGLIGEGTGGFTDAFMNRVVLPLTGNYADNDHVLGHEIVHVFQYDIASSSARNQRRFNLEAMPLWIVEGMAEYLSKGRIDPLTAMWVRDAVIHDRLPDLRKLTRDPRYFPYRYGQALMAYIGGRFGDDAVVRYFLAAGQVGIEEAFPRATGISAKQLFVDWQESARELYNPVVQARPDNLGEPILGEKRTKGNLNVGPAYSPDGRYIAFLSTRELFSIDLFLADATTGRIIRRLVSSDRDQHFESLRFIDSAGGWSPDSKRLAFVTFSRGDNFLSLVDVETRAAEHIRVPGVDALTNPVFTPDGRSVVLSGQTTGVTDLFLYNLDTREIRRLTNDKFADLQPAVSPDGRTVAFVTDRGPATSLEQLRFSEMRLATVDIESGRVRELPLFENARHINPQWSPDGNSLYFVADPEGVSDVYRYSMADGRIERVTAVQTGVSGITEMSPALSVSQRTGAIAFSLFEDDDYNIYSLQPQTAGTVVAATAAPDAPRAGVLPPFRATGSAITGYLQAPEQGLLPANTDFRQRDYDPSLRLAYLGPPTIGVGTDAYGFGVGGSLSAYFTDILGQHNVGFAFQGGGSSTSNITDQLAAELFYLNQKNRVNWGADLVHVPYVTSPVTFYERRTVTINGQQYLADILSQERSIITIDDVSGLTQYPFSTTRRIEAAAGYQRYGEKREVETLVFIGDELVDRDLDTIGGGLNLDMLKASTAFVGDSSVFGFVSPVRGTRYRYEVETLTGDLKFTTALADWRKYFFMRPVTLAIRGLHYGRYGSGAEDERIAPLDVGRPSLVRGYDIYSINVNECNTPGAAPGTCPVYDRLVGSRIAVASAELRVPLFGTKEFGLINAPFLPTEFIAFGDAGAAWNQGQTPDLRYATNTADRVPVFSAGVGLRILLSYIPIEIYAAKAFQRPDEEIVYGFNILPGW